MQTYYTLSYAPGSILSDTNDYIVLYVFLVVSMATNVMKHLAIISILGVLQEVYIINTVRPYEITFDQDALHKFAEK